MQLQSKAAGVDHQIKPSSTAHRFSLKLKLPSALKGDKNRIMTNIDSPTPRRAVTMNMPTRTPVQSINTLKQNLAGSSNRVSAPEPVPMEAVDTVPGNTAEQLTKQVQEMCVDQGVTHMDQRVAQSYKGTCSLSVQKLTTVDQNIKPPAFLSTDVAPKLTASPQVGGIESVDGVSLFSSSLPSNPQTSLEQASTCSYLFLIDDYCCRHVYVGGELC